MEQAFSLTKTMNFPSFFSDEVIIPKDANVYYAMATNNKEKGLYFLLRKDELFNKGKYSKCQM